MNTMVGWVPLTDPYMLPPGEFEALIGQIGQRVSWMRSHTCPCIYGAAAPGLNRLPTQGTAQSSCLRCFGVGTYWDAPSPSMRVSISYMHLSPSPDEPGTIMNDKFGTAITSEPSMTLPYLNPFLPTLDPGQPTTAWTDASTNDIFVAVDMLSRYTASLFVDKQVNLPFQQNLQVRPAGAVTIWNPTTKNIDFVQDYTVSGSTVTIQGYPAGTGYMVEFQAAPIYVAFRRAGGLPHVRPLGGGKVFEPRRFRLQTLDFWTRERKVTESAVGSAMLAGTSTSIISGTANILVV